MSKQCERCQWSAWKDVREADFGVKLGNIRTCSICGWREFADYTALRAGSITCTLPPALPMSLRTGEE